MENYYYNKSKIFHQSSWLKVFIFSVSHLSVNFMIKTLDCYFERDILLSIYDN